MNWQKIPGQITQDMATAFMTVASVSVYIEEEGTREYAPVINGNSTVAIREQIGITYDGLINLQSVGLIETHFSGIGTELYVTAEKTPVVIRYFDEEYQLLDEVNKFKVGKVIYTKAGQALCQAVTPQKVDVFFEKHCIPLWEKGTKRKPDSTISK